MRKLTIFLLFTVILACASSSPQRWIDADTLEIRALGRPRPEATGMVARRTSAREAAITEAQRLLLEYVQAGGKEAPEEMEAKLRGGIIVEERYDEEDDSCRVVYRVTAPGLKLKLTGSY